MPPLNATVHTKSNSHFILTHVLGSRKYAIHSDAAVLDYLSALLRPSVFAAPIILGKFSGQQL